MNSKEELSQITDTRETVAAAAEAADVVEPLQAIKESALNDCPTLHVVAFG
jgi:hypothetical protein